MSNNKLHHAILGTDFSKAVSEIIRNSGIFKTIGIKKVTLTAMGNQGRGFFEEILIGSVSHQVARNSSSNVLIVPLP